MLFFCPTWHTTALFLHASAGNHWIIDKWFRLPLLITRCTKRSQIIPFSTSFCPPNSGTEDSSTKRDKIANKDAWMNRTVFTGQSVGFYFGSFLPFTVHVAMHFHQDIRDFI